MGDSFSSALSSFLNYSNFYSIVLILICFCGMVIFIVRLNGDHFANRFYQPQSQPVAVPMTRMVGVNNPFILTLDVPLSSSLNDGVHCTLNCNQQSELYTYWGLDLNSVHIKIRRHWQIILSEIKDRTMFSSQQCCVQDEPRVFEPGETHTTHLMCDSITEEELGQPPRLKYPLVVILVPCDTPSQEDPNVVAMVTIFHLKDSICTGTSHIVYQFVISNTGQVCPLQQLYVNQPEASSQAEDDQQERDCVVCQNARASRALLPCRHACICGSCFKKVDKCPMCRGNIDSFFFLDGFEGGEVQAPPEEVDYSNMTWGERFEHWNDRLNDMFGFT
ncbi:cell growth regulator with RING finger domain protein 1-like [Lineus longissimus]|uniref:cell growth regulator with RING finger domain protein 1-like n=1 Tax=Lineus longissimus TaxID=88925 RepID=UPI002B4F8B6A